MIKRPHFVSHLRRGPVRKFFLRHDSPSGEVREFVCDRGHSSRLSFVSPWSVSLFLHHGPGGQTRVSLKIVSSGTNSNRDIWLKKIVNVGFIMIIFMLCGFNPAVADDILSINGCGGWAYGWTDNGYRYLVGHGDGNYDNIDLALNLAIQSHDHVNFHIQTSYQERFSENEVELEFCFADLFMSDMVNVRIGKIKAAHMLYTEVFNVGTLRPFFTLPQGIYHDFTAEAYKGIGLTGTLLDCAGWEISYDLYAGKVNMKPYRMAFVVGVGPESGEPEAVYGEMYWSSRDTLGGRFLLSGPRDGLLFGVSAFTGLVDINLEIMKLKISEHLCERFSFLGFSAEYVDEIWLVRSEYLFNTQGDVKFEAGYLEIGRRVMQHLQFTARYEYEIEKDSDTSSIYGETLSSSSLLRHRDFAVGVNYWFSEALVFKVSWHMVSDNRFAMPNDIDEYTQSMLSGRFKERTHLLLIGIQFSF